MYSEKTYNCSGQLLLVGKLSYMGGFNASRLGHLVFLKDHTTGALFLADTGFSVPGYWSSVSTWLPAHPRKWGGHHYRSREVSHPSPEGQQVGPVPVHGLSFLSAWALPHHRLPS